jgi:hypothetical protein
MRRDAASRCLVLLLAIASAACSNDKKGAVADANTPPTKYRQEIIATLREIFVHNGTVRVSNAFVTDPVIKTVDSAQLYTVCVRYTAHGTSPDLVGNAERVGYFYAGHLNQLIPDENGQCRSAAYKPFQELERLCIGTGCRR